jgi:hypothetical protein
LNELILYLSPIPWDHVRQRPHHFAGQLAIKRSVIFVSNPATANDKWVSKGRLRFVAPQLYELHPPKIGPTSRAGNFLAQSRSAFGHKLINGIIVISRFINSLNYIIAGLYIRLLILRFKPKRVIVWVSSPAYLFSIVFLGKKDLLVYDRLDDFSNMAGYGNETKLWDLIMTIKADIVFSSSEKLHSFAKSYNAKAVMLRNAVEYEHFSKKVEMGPPLEISTIPKPRIGFIGVVGNWLDLSLIKQISVSHPEWHFVFIGPIESRIDILANVTNVHFLGKKPYELLPIYLRYIDVCILPFKVNDMTNSVNPIKLYEYSAAGKPIISTRIKEVTSLQKFVTIVDTPEQFSRAISVTLGHPDLDKIQSGQKFAASNDWSNRLSLIEMLIASS